MATRRDRKYLRRMARKLYGPHHRRIEYKCTGDSVIKRALYHGAGKKAVWCYRGYDKNDRAHKFECFGSLKEAKRACRREFGSH